VTPERWQVVKATLHEALARPTGFIREAYLRNLGTQDPALRAELDSLLAAERIGRERFATPAPALLADAVPEPTLDQLPDGASHTGSTAGERVGPYELLRPLGTGGMGEVWVARRADAAFKREVALKLPLQSLRHDFLVRRFERERDILAVLEHPNIARLYDAGVDEKGLPYLAMELVDGVPINRYCELHDLSVEARLRLLIEVCSAVHYAHQRLVIHRDIKPGNILVTAAGTPKLLDFGIAKLLESTAAPSGTVQTAAVVRLFTRVYASPEQVNGGQITTASDVYSLGILLFELLHGHAPSQSASGAVITAAIRRPVGAGAGEARGAGALPSLTRRQRKDLDNIVRMATQPDPARRYLSVEQMAADLQRHMDMLPIVARKDTLAYRVSTFIARHSVAVALTSVAMVAIVLAMASTLYEARIARLERARSERRFNDARQLANALMSEIYGAVRDLPGATPARRLLVTDALQYLDGLSRDASGDAALERELARAYSMVGDVQGNPYYANLGDPRSALQSYRKALLIRSRLSAAAPQDRELIRQLSGSYNGIGAALGALGDFTGSLQSFQKSLQLLAPAAAHSSDPATLDQFAGAYFYVAGAAQRAGDLKLSADSIRQAARIRDSIVVADPRLARDIDTHRAGDHERAAVILEEEQLFPEALQESERAVAILLTLADREPNNATIRSFLAESYFESGSLQQQMGNLADAEQAFLRAEQVNEAILGADPKDALARLNLASDYRYVGTLQVRRGRLAAGLKSLKLALAVTEPLASVDRSNASARTSLAATYFGLGSALEAQATLEHAQQRQRGELRSACQWLRRSAELWSSVGNEHLLDASEREEPEKANRALSACETQLAREGG